MKLLSPLIALFQAVFLTLWLVFWITASGLAAILSLNGEVPLMMARRFWAPMHWRITGSPLLVEPLPDVDWTRPHIFLMNHQSIFDIPVAFAVIPANIRFIAKHVLKWVPFLGWYMTGTGMIFINRSNRRAAMRSLKLAGERIRAGSNILVFPEGTRSKDGLILPFKKGSFVLAVEAGVPIIPMAVEGTRDMLPSGSILLRRHPIRVKMGQPIATAGIRGAARDALVNQVRDAIIQLHRDIGGPGGVPQDELATGSDKDSNATDPSETPA
ncbi:1-acyl-sn-glycerol-3-phosphate acyltransferase [Vitiosangium sp. GDMCC 1.1324]|uniref:lysophospholipid acyltransferase family protein n=1 Tax=Vitiosangium sp. (strain GDMCC 1.1324) TaxID=2138576 RepID=UPI000D3C4F47|nr:lysophospholipid acyltransferase family protein [Vitiosangium sp. GDMCC 1.1324]PTL79073.1 1-acyl-sn-glycerol-3-phosphate acyltransferase [Vitiosangium sp. GDMCC 1.1324]